MNQAWDSTVALVVEDNDQVRRFEVHALRAAGFDVLEATSGPEGLAVLGTCADRVHILLSDVIMPRMSGIDLACAAVRVQPNIRIVFISGYSAEILGHATLECVPHAFLEKPFSAQKLLDCISGLLARGPETEFGEAAAALV